MEKNIDPSLMLERVYPYLLMLAALLLWCRLDLSFPKTDPILSATLSTAGIFVGFLATSKAILLSMNSPIIDRLRSSGYMAVLASYIAQAIWLNLLLCMFNVFGYFKVQEESWYGAIWVSLAVGGISSFIRVTHVMLKIFKHH